MNNLLDCGHEPSEHSAITTGYGTNRETGKTFCYDCAAEIEKKRMIEHGRTLLYLTKNESGFHFLTDWPGKLRFHVRWNHIKRNRHNFAGNRYDYWFNGPDGHIWHGYTVGDNTQIAHCKRTKELTRGGTQ